MEVVSILVDEVILSKGKRDYKQAFYVKHDAG